MIQSCSLGRKRRWKLSSGAHLQEENHLYKQNFQHWNNTSLTTSLVSPTPSTTKHTFMQSKIRLFIFLKHNFPSTNLFVDGKNYNNMKKKVQRVGNVYIYISLYLKVSVALLDGNNYQHLKLMILYCFINPYTPC